MKNDASGVLYAVGGAGGGLTVYLDKDYLIYEYNMLIIEQYSARSQQALSAIEIATDIAGPGWAGTATLSVDSEEVAKAELERIVPAAFTAIETFDVGADLGSPVSMNYFEWRPFEFDGKITKLTVQLVKSEKEPYKERATRNGGELAALCRPFFSGPLSKFDDCNLILDVVFLPGHTRHYQDEE